MRLYKYNTDSSTNHRSAGKKGEEDLVSGMNKNSFTRVESSVFEAGTTVQCRYTPSRELCHYFMVSEVKVFKYQIVKQLL